MKLTKTIFALASLLVVGAVAQANTNTPVASKIGNKTINQTAVKHVAENFPTPDTFGGGACDDAPDLCRSKSVAIYQPEPFNPTDPVDFSGDYYRIPKHTAGVVWGTIVLPDGTVINVPVPTERKGPATAGVVWGTIVDFIVNPFAVIWGT